ncbi:LptE family protein [Sphingobacterium sp. UT-1RO-CII-1]|uniref:LptE family protein n=1 Tax=Sphingobacterium sp. UT-1RO-CII-1 TaxID=2995225 RepID=UPI00227BAD6D|nr:LptE family protein [Sphingobacterium sp. UT-1RO-CII-1]MCY4780983.1 LptE family protein [Sphingobacterium sp. UT-1RO-CII-1]
MRNSLSALFFVLILFFAQSCGVKYGFTGGSIPENMKTVNVQFFENIAPMVYATLGQNFTEGLKERIRNQSRLSQVSGNADAMFEGVITGYDITPAAVEANTDRAALNRLTITVKVKYTNNLDETGESSFEETFTQYREFAGQVQAQEESLNVEIIKLLTEDVYNRAFANW